MPVTLTGVSSVTHLLYAASWLRAQVDTGVDIDVTVREPGMILGRARVTPHDVSTYLPHDERLRVMQGGDPAYADVSSDLQTLLCVGAPGLRTFVQFSRRQLRLPRVVVVDEGIGSYGDVRTRLAAYRRAGGRGAWPVVRAAAVANGHRLLTSQNWTTYRRRGDSPRDWEVNPAVAAEFARHRSGESAPPRTAVYLTQPWPDLGVMSGRDYLRHLWEVRLACLSVGLSLVVHPHPADDATRYADHEVRNQPRPAELDPFVVSAAVVIGSNSTALLNLAALEKVPAVRVTMPQTAALEDALSHDQRDLLNCFLPPVVGTQALAPALATVLDGPGSRGSPNVVR